MNIRLHASALLVGLGVSLTAHAESFGPPMGQGPFDRALAQVAPGVYVSVRPDPFRNPAEGNISFIVNDEDVVVVDAGGTELSAENAIKQLRGVTDKPVRYIVISHWHGDHNYGLPAWQRAYPGVEIIGQTNTREVMLSSAAADILHQYKTGYAGLQTQITKALASGMEADGKTPLSPVRRDHLKSVDADIKVYRAELDKVQITPPSLTLDQDLVLYRGKREIHVLYPGLGNTNGDLAVWLPQEGVLMTGDLLPNPIPFGYGSYPKEWVTALDKLAALAPKTLIPGHGDVQHDLGYLHQVQTLLRMVTEQVTSLVQHGGTLDEARAKLDLGDAAKPFRDTPKKSQLFDEEFVKPIVEMAYKEAKGEPIVQGAG